MLRLYESNSVAENFLERVGHISVVLLNAMPVNVYGFPLFNVKRFLILFLDRENEGQRSPYVD